MSENEIRAMLGFPEDGTGLDDDDKEGKKKMPRGRPPKNAYKAPTRVERQELLRTRIMNLKEELENAGFGALLAPPSAILPIADPVPDPKTKGLIAHVEEPLGAYIQRVSVQDNFAQRQPFDHLKDPIYMRLIRDFIEGAAMPEAKVAALATAAGGDRAQSLTQPDIRYSVIDGLQRLYCYLIAILLVFQREKLHHRSLNIDTFDSIYVLMGMPFPRKLRPVQLSAEERLKLESIRKSRTEERRRTLRAAFLLDSLSGQSDEAIAQHHHVSRSTVVLCIQKFLQFGLEAALGELPRPGKPRQLPDDAIVWVQHCACRKPKELGYSYELWTYKLLVAHVRQHCVAAGHPALLRLSRSKLHKILRQGELRPHKIRYYVEKRDPDFEIKMANVLHVYKEVEMVNEYRRGEAARQLGMGTISYDEKPGIQALATTTPDRPPVVGTHPSHLRDDEYVRLGTVSLLAGLDLHTGRVTETVSDTHTSGDFIAFLQKLDNAYPEHHQIRLVLDNHSAHISKETRGYLQTMPQRFVFVFTPKHGSWLNLIENQFSKMTRTMLRGIRVASKQELIDRIHQYFEEVNAAPVVFHWKYKMDEIIIV